MQHRGTVRVDHPFRATCGARGVAHGNRIVFRVCRVFKMAAIRAGQPLFIIHELCRHIGARKGKHDDFLKVVLVLNLAIERQQNVIDDQKTVFSIVCNPSNFVGRKTQIQSVHDTASRRNAKVTFQMRMVVPTQGGHPIAFFQTQIFQALSQASCAVIKLCVGMLDERFIRQSRNDFVCREQSARSVQEMIDGQVHLHHGAAYICARFHRGHSMGV